MIARIAGLLPECIAGGSSLDEDLGLDSPGRAELLSCGESELSVYLDEARSNRQLRVYAT